MLITLFVSGCNSKSETEREITNEILTENESEENKDPNEMYYELANEAIKENNYLTALSYLKACDGYLDSTDKMEQIQGDIDKLRNRSSCYILGGSIPSISLMVYINDNLELEVLGTGKNEYEIDMDEWQDLKSVKLAWGAIIGIKNDGTVLMAKRLQEPSKIDISDWTDIKEIEVADLNHEGDFIVGLKNDGTVVYERSESYLTDNTFMEDVHPENVESWDGVEHIYAREPYGILGITNDGKILCSIQSELTEVQGAYLMDVENFCAAVGDSGVAFAGGAKVIAPGLEGLIDIKIAHDFVAFLFEDGRLILESLELGELSIEQFEFSNILAISLADDYLLAAYEADGTINLIGSTSRVPADWNLKNTPINLCSLETRKKETVVVEKGPVEPKIGMTQDEVLESTWGAPEKKNITENTYGIFEQWVYPDYQYLYFDNGLLTAIQKSE